MSDHVSTSVVIPLFNKEKYIAAALDSVCSAPLVPTEIVIVDDCSSDQSLARVEAWLATYSGPVRVVLLRHEYNQGPLAARLTAIRNATSRFVAFLDADDCWDANFYIQVEAVLQKYPRTDLLSVAFYSTRLAKQIFRAKDFESHCERLEGALYRVLDLEAVLCQNFILGGGNVIALRSLFDDFQPLFKDRIFEDWCVWLALIRQRQEVPSILFLDQALYVYNDEVDQSLSNSRLSQAQTPTLPAVIGLARELGFFGLKRVLFWCWITNSCRRMPGILARLRFFGLAGAGRGQYCLSRYCLSGLLCVIFGDSVVRLANTARRFLRSN